ncbi:MAG: fasciclin domain-containing protein [Pseudomonadota bacterium]
MSRLPCVIKALLKPRSEKIRMLKRLAMAMVLIGALLGVTIGVSATQRGAETFNQSSPTQAIQTEDEYCTEHLFEADDCEAMPLRELRAELKNQGKTLAVVMADYENLRRFRSMIEASGLMQQIESAGPFTVFAPTDQAVLTASFGSLGLQADARTKEKLRQALATHIVAGAIHWEQLAGRRTTLTSISGSTIVVDGRNGIRIGKSQVTNSDVLAANGVLHIVDAVISGQGERVPGV